jgi:hypothetical protein
LSRRVESDHPCCITENTFRTVTIPGAEHLLVYFDGRCKSSTGALVIEVSGLLLNWHFR